MSALDVARELVLRRGFQVVPVAFRGKVPTDPRTDLPMKEWEKLRLGAGDLHKYFNGKPQNVGFVCGEPSGHLVDIDLDCDEAVELGPHFLPGTSLIFGRAGRPKSHWLYISTLATMKFHDTKAHESKMLVERRSNGCQTVAPGSTHESGEPILWSLGYDQKPAVVAPDVLSRAVSRLAAATILARHYPAKGARHVAKLDESDLSPVTKAMIACDAERARAAASVPSKTKRLDAAETEGLSDVTKAMIAAHDRDERRRNGGFNGGGGGHGSGGFDAAE
jgi:Bifunctional DNA primase/polymerase, N-terminal